MCLPCAACFSFVCPPRTYSTGHQDQCTPCAPGSVSGAGATACVGCNLGEWFDTDAASCKQCPPGRFASALFLLTSNCTGPWCVSGFLACFVSACLLVC
jgi:hypothetical protein